MFCGNCGTQVPDGTRFCSECGHPLSPRPIHDGAYQPPAQPEQPAQPTQPVQPEQPAQPVQPEQSAQPIFVQPVQSGYVQWSAPDIPAPAKKSGGKKWIVFLVIGILLAALAVTAYIGYQQGWFDTFLDDRETTSSRDDKDDKNDKEDPDDEEDPGDEEDPSDETEPSESEDEALAEYRWEAITFFCDDEDMELTNEDVDFAYFVGRKIDVCLTLYLLSEEVGDDIRNGKDFCLEYQSWVEDGYEDLVRDKSNGVYYLKGTYIEDGVPEVSAFYVVGDYGYVLSVYASDMEKYEEQMIQIATTAELDEDHVHTYVPAGDVPADGSVAYDLSGLLYYLDPSFTEEQNDGITAYYSSEIASVTVNYGPLESEESGICDAEDFAEVLYQFATEAGLKVDRGEKNGVPYLICEEEDGGSVLAMSFYTSGDMGWTIQVDTLRLDMTDEALIEILTCGLITA